jgi:GT2 family glycosyltransferase
VTPFTVVVPFHGPVALVEPLLRSLDGQDGDLRPRVIVSDDASSPPVAPGVEGLGLRNVDVEVIRCDQNGGPGAARNRALRSVETPWVAFLDGDVIPRPDWVQKMASLIEQTDADVVEGVAVMGGGEVSPFTHSTETAPPDRHGAGNVAFKTDLLRSVGGFSEEYFDPIRKVHFREDADITFRLERAGATYDFDPDLVVEHPPLEPSFWTPIRLARRYYFDALLGREHPDEYEDMHSIRKVGPVSLRAARHHAANGFVVGVLVLMTGIVSGWRTIRTTGLVLLLVSWAANVVALCWKRTVRPRHVVPVIAAAALVPFTYVYHFWRGVITFRHHPRPWK